MVRSGFLLLASLFFFWPSAPSFAQETEPVASIEAAAGEAAKEEAALQKIVDGLNYQQGHIVLKDGLASLNVPESFRYLNAADAETVLSQLWGNQPDEDRSSLGMLIPAGVNPLSEDAWAVTISYSEDGYVKDDEASKTNYDEQMKQMQESTREANADRVKNGYPAIELLGWAQPPRYDAATHKMYWAKELQVAEMSQHTLNFNIRMLGRRGVLVLNAIAGMPQLSQIEKEIPAVLQMVDFQDGHRYTDFNPSTDKVATYGLAALVTGGILAKAGFFKLIFPALLAAKKFVVIGAVALISYVKRLFSRMKEN